MSQEDKEAWVEEFKIICEIMRNKNEIIRTLPDRGIIIWLKDLECKNCHSKGVFYGDELEYGEFYECASATYCPNCKTVYDVIMGKNFAPFDQERFLPLMKKKLLANPELLKKLESEPNLPPEYRNRCCPICGGRTYTFVKDLGGVDNYINYWTVCVNPNCDWPGDHHEEYEPGPFC